MDPIFVYNEDDVNNIMILICDKLYKMIILPSFKWKITVLKTPMDYFWDSQIDYD